MDTLVLLILIPPLAAAAFNGLVGLFWPAWRKREWLIGGLGVAAVALPFVVAVSMFIGFHGEPEVIRYFTWMVAGDLQVDFAYRIDQLSLLMTLIITGVGSLIHLYSIGYMHGDSGFWRFFPYMNLFIFMMLNLVLAENLVVLFLGWEGVGLCSYLLIGFWYTDLKNSAAANKAFIMNRVGDFAFLLAMFILFRTVTANQAGVFGLDFTTILGEGTLALLTTEGVAFWVCLLLFIGATGKSAQIPLFTWLPDAMAGPTPVSALIHAATMVTSGLYLLARVSPLVLTTPSAMALIAIVGALTALMAATIAMTQNDIKKVLAYSTVSQLGYMFLAAGVGAFFVSIFHVMTHAFFKACLFLGSGSVIHAMHNVEHDLEHKGIVPGGEGPEEGKEYAGLPYEGGFDAQDMRTMGGLGKYMPSTRWTYLIATLAIAGIPFLAGFFSKDEILFKAFEYGFDGHLVGYFTWAIGIATALLTAIYMVRSYLLTFEGSPRWPNALDTRPHESPWTMTLPLWVLAAFSIIGGFFGLTPVIAELFGTESWIHHWLSGEHGPVAEFHHGIAPGQSVEWILLIVGAAIAIVGVGLAWTFFGWGRRGPEADASVERITGGVAYRSMQRKWYWDEVYDALVVQPVVRLARRGFAVFDKKVVDGAVNAIASAVASLSQKMRGMQTGVVQTYALGIVLGVVAVIALILYF